MYQIIDRASIKYPHTVQMYFEIPYPDWCILEKTDVFRLLLEYLEGLEKRDSKGKEKKA